MRKSYSFGRSFRRNVTAITSTVVNTVAAIAVNSYEMPRDFVRGVIDGDAPTTPTIIANKRRRKAAK
jgi:hypothetical protein